MSGSEYRYEGDGAFRRRPLLLLLLSLIAFLGAASAHAAPPASVETVTVRWTPGHRANIVRADRALGAGVDGLHEGGVARTYTLANLTAMRSAHLRPLTYRLRTELAVEAWHWNTVGSWSEPGKGQGYWASSAVPHRGARLQTCWGYRLPRRGTTTDQANNDGYSRLDDGDPTTFWKSNPYLDTYYTHEDTARWHPQWVVLDLGSLKPVDTLRVLWGEPYARRWRAEYFVGDVQESIDDTFEDGSWRPFGADFTGHSGAQQVRLSTQPVRARFVRLWLLQGSGTAAASAKSHDVRDRLGFAIREIYCGVANPKAPGGLRDALRHGKTNETQSKTYASSVDPWHRAADRDTDTEQPGFDRVIASGLTSGQPLLTPVAVLYDTPENAVAELKWLRGRHYPVNRMELGEEPDGQYIAPEDYGALYIRFAGALHRVDPRLALGGPSFQTTVTGWVAWPDASGDTHWMRRFLRYLASHGHAQDFAFFSLEWYPFDDIHAPTSQQLARGPKLLQDALDRLTADGLRRDIPWLVSEYGYSTSDGQPEVEMAGALYNAELCAQFLTMGGDIAYFYGYEPNWLSSDGRSDPPSWGCLSLFLADGDGRAKRPLATYYAARLLVDTWLEPTAQNALYPASGEAPSSAITAYAARRSDGRWSLLLLNKDPQHAHRVRLRTYRTDTGETRTLGGRLERVTYGTEQYVWHPRGENGYASPNRPPVHTLLPATDPIVDLPPYSMTVVRQRR